mgnify:CR=1 FL=1
MERHRLGFTLGTMKTIDQIIHLGVDPISVPVTYAEVGQDLSAVPIEAGFGSAKWSWVSMAQADYDLLLDLQTNVPGIAVYVRTSKKSGASGIDFANFTAIAKRPNAEERVGLLCKNVTLEFIKMTEL